MKLPKTRLAILAIGLALAAPVAAFLHYNLPRHLVVRVVGADVLRYDNKDTRHPSVQGGPSRDIYQIFTESLDERRKPFVLHNEDTGFHFPWYVKFNSADIQSEATSMAGERATALITYYGWRVNFLSMFPNVLAIRRVPADYVAIPWFNIAFFGILAGLAGWAALAVRRFRRRRRLASAPARDLAA